LERISTGLTEACCVAAAFVLFCLETLTVTECAKDLQTSEYSLRFNSSLVSSSSISCGAPFATTPRGD